MLNSVNLNETGAITPVNSQNYNISYRGGTNSLERTPEADTYNKKKMGKGTKIALGTVGLAGVLITIDRLALKGRYTDDILKWFKRNSDDVAKQADEVVENAEKALEKNADEAVENAEKVLEKNADEVAENAEKALEKNADEAVENAEKALEKNADEVAENAENAVAKEGAEQVEKEGAEQGAKAVLTDDQKALQELAEEMKQNQAKKTKVLEGENVELVDGGNTFTLNKGEVVGYKNANGEDLLSRYKTPETDGDKAYKAIIEEKIAKIKTAELDPIRDGYDENLANEVIEILKNVK